MATSVLRRPGDTGEYPIVPTADSRDRALAAAFAELGGPDFAEQLRAEQAHSTNLMDGAINRPNFTERDIAAPENVDFRRANTIIRTAAERGGHGHHLLHAVSSGRVALGANVYGEHTPATDYAQLAAGAALEQAAALQSSLEAARTAKELRAVSALAALAAGKGIRVRTDPANFIRTEPNPEPQPIPEGSGSRPQGAERHVVSAKPARHRRIGPFAQLVARLRPASTMRPSPKHRR